MTGDRTGGRTSERTPDRTEVRCGDGIGDRAAADTVLLRLTAVVAGWAVPVVGPVSVQVTAGEVLGLWGGNGSGKSTLLSAIARGARVFAGAIWRAPGLTLSYQEQHQARPAPMPLSGRDLLGAAGVAAGQVPPGPLGGRLHRRLDRLSGGEYQWLQVWAALARPAGLVLLDEPTNNLDPEHEERLAGVLVKESGRPAPRSLPPGPTRGRDAPAPLAPPCAVLVVSHERPFLDRVCTRIIEVQPWR